MLVVTEIQRELERLDQQILGLLEARRRLCSEGGLEDAQETLGLWLDEAANRNLDEETMERIAKLVVRVSRRGEE